MIVVVVVVAAKGSFEVCWACRNGGVSVRGDGFVNIMKWVAEVKAREHGLAVLNSCFLGRG